MSELVCRPPIGFIVEGHGEYFSYPSLICRALGTSGIRFPIVNAGGNGRILRGLSDELDDLVSTYQPLSVIITLDLRDVIRAGDYENCSDLCEFLYKEIEQWRERARSDPRIKHIPSSIGVVVQIQKLESWLIADIEGLKSSGYLAEDVTQIDDVDNSVLEPAKWLSDKILNGLSAKNPKNAKQLVSALCISTMRANSSSFDKFVRDVKAAYKRWEDACDIESA